MANERYRHIYLEGPSRTQDFTNPRSGGTEPRIPDRTREAHSEYVRARMNDAWQAAEGKYAVAHADRTGVYLDFMSDPGHDLTLKSLEDTRAGIRLLHVKTEGEGEHAKTVATVYVPNEKRANFIRKIDAYANEIDGRSKKPKNQKLVNSIGDIQSSILESFWRDDERPYIPGDHQCPVEVWLSGDSQEVFDRFRLACGRNNIGIADGILRFPERTVILIQANRQHLERLISVSDDIAEFRAAKALSTYYLEQTNQDQLEQVQEFLNRVAFDANALVSVCILDSGVNNSHLLLAPVLNNADLHSALPMWGTADECGHGTLMAGTVAYGDLLEALQNGAPLHVVHLLESAKILPPTGGNLKELWGHRTSQGLSKAEIQAPDRQRICCLAVTAMETRDRGRPSSWSAHIDQLCAGWEDERKRLFIVSAGNVSDPKHWRNYPADNLTNDVHDPGQSWNALTVGAYTTKDRILDRMLQGYEPIAPTGGLSPYSSTSTDWESKWPIKPEVVFEGGNVAKGPNDSVFESDDLTLISTYMDPHVAQFSRFCATSAASAQAAWMAAQIQHRYPDAWPETVRALIVHSAEWTEAMRKQFLPENPNKGNREWLLKICGYGVPSLERALYCAASSLTLISQAQLQPYGINSKSNRVTKDMHLYSLPWPREVLEQMGGTTVTMRITLSYYIEPGPGEVGWKDRYRYPSHALRFDLNSPVESETEFIRRVNKLARGKDGHPGTTAPSESWLFGEARNKGSIHSDIWQGTASDLAASNLVAVYPAVGWWRERHHLGRVENVCRYSLLVSIHTEEENIDIYTPVAAQVGIPIEVMAI